MISVVSTPERASIASQPGLRSIAILQVALAITVWIAFWPTTQSLVIEWENTDNATYTHGYLVAAIALWLLFRNRDYWGSYRITPEPLGALLLISLGFIWLVSLRAGMQTVHQMLLPILSWATIFVAFGRQIALKSVLPFAYLYFAIPVWGAINDLLQRATVVATEVLLRVSGIPALVEGNMVELAAGSFEIAGGCSGMHFFIVAIAIAVLYGELNRDSFKGRLQLVLLAIVLALVTNWLRVYTIIVAGYLTDMQHYLVRVDHYVFGWCVFAACMVIFFLVARRFPVHAKHEDAVEASAATSVGTLAFGAAFAIAGFSIAPIWNLLSPVAPAAHAESIILLPSKLNGWIGPQISADSSWRPVFLRADRSQMGEYRSVRSGALVEMFTAAYAKQTQGKELVGYGNSIADDHDGAQTRSDMDGKVAELMTSENDSWWLIWYYYDIDGLRTANGGIAQVYYGLASLWRDPLSTVVALRTKCVSDCAAERGQLKDFMLALKLRAELGGSQRETGE